MKGIYFYQLQIREFVIAPKNDSKLRLFCFFSKKNLIWQVDQIFIKLDHSKKISNKSQSEI